MVGKANQIRALLKRESVKQILVGPGVARQILIGNQVKGVAG
jgi:hypothetical protein